MPTFQLWTSRKHRITMMQLIFQFRKMSEKTLYRDESVFTWLIYKNLLLPWEKKILVLQSLLHRSLKIKAATQKWTCIR